MIRRPMTKEDHIELADMLATLEHHIGIVENKLREHYEPDTRIRENFSKLAFLNTNGIFVDILGDLDDHYNDLRTDEDNTKLGFPYIDFQQRYEDLQSAL